jgi:hypothetical protein
MSEQQLFEVFYEAKVSGVTVIRAESAEQAQQIVADPTNWSVLHNAASPYVPVVVKSVSPTEKPGETEDNLGGIISAIPRIVVPATPQSKSKKKSK